MILQGRCCSLPRNEVLRIMIIDILKLLFTEKSLELKIKILFSICYVSLANLQYMFCWLRLHSFQLILIGSYGSFIFHLSVAFVIVLKQQDFRIIIDYIEATFFSWMKIHKMLLSENLLDIFFSWYFYQSKSDERKNIFEPQTSKPGQHFFIKETISLNSSFV